MLIIQSTTMIAGSLHFIWNLEISPFICVMAKYFLKLWNSIL